MISLEVKNISVKYSNLKNRNFKNINKIMDF